MSEQLNNPYRVISYCQEQKKPSLNIYCQPCLKRGLMKMPAYVNLNQFQKNRYICESCSYGQTYIITLGKQFFSQNGKKVKIENKLKTITEDNNQQQQLSASKSVNEDNQQTLISEETVEQNNKTMLIMNLTQSSSTQQKVNQLSQQQTCQLPLPQFVKNIQVNSNPFSKYSIADISMYTENIALQYKQATNVINNYEDMIKSHINKWRNKLKVQFEGVIGTFGTLMASGFLKELKLLEQIHKDIKFLQQAMKAQEQNNQNPTIENSHLSSEQMQRIINLRQMVQNSSLKHDIKSQSNNNMSLNQLYTETLELYKIQEEKTQLYVETLKMSGIRNLSNLKSLYNCCKGFSDAVKILISLQHKQTNRRFEFISQKLKVCSIQTLYDAEMINGGYLDNRLQKPPGFDAITQQTQKKRNQNFNIKKIINPSPVDNKKIEPAINHKNDSTDKSEKTDNFKLPKIINQQHKNNQESIKTSDKPFILHEISLISSQSQRQESIVEEPKYISQSHIIKQNILLQFKQDSIEQKNLKQEILAQQILLQKQNQEERQKFAKIKSKKPFQSSLLNQNLIERQAIKQTLQTQKNIELIQKEGSEISNRIDLQQSMFLRDYKNQTQHEIQDTNTPFPGLRKYYQYEKNQNLFVSKLQLTKQNFQTFPPPNIYMPSVQSLTIKYCPQTTDTLELLKTLKSCFKKLNELIVEEPKLGTKQTIIMIAEYFPKLKSLIFRCKNQFDWQLGKLFERKMGHLVRFQVNDGQTN